MTVGKNQTSNTWTAALWILVLFAIQTGGGMLPKACAGWFKQSDRELLHQAVTSDNPRTVEKRLDMFIKKHNHTAILQIKHHARAMRFAVRRKLNREKKLNPEEVKKQLAPWVRIEQKADLFFKRSASSQQHTAP